MKSIFAALVLGFGAIAGAQADTIDTLSFVSGSELHCLNSQAECFQSMGQTFGVSGVNPVLTSISLGMGTSGDGVAMSFDIYAWGGNNTAGASLYHSSGTYGGDPTDIVFAPNLALTSGANYLAVFSVNEISGVSLGLQTVAGDSYAGGAMWTQKAGGAWALTTPDYDTRFSATFAHPDTVTPVPEPETYAMMLAGLALLGAARRFVARG